MAATPANVAAIQALRAAGYSYRGIERALGIGGSGRLVKYAAESKPAPNLTGPLQALAAGRQPAPVQRLVSPTSVRRPVVSTTGGGSAADVRTTRGKTVRAMIRAAAAAGRKVSMVVTFARGQVYGGRYAQPATIGLFEKGGWGADKLLEELEGNPSWDAGLQAIAERKPGVEWVDRPITRWEVTIL